tara:strand:- start:33495 stop:33680 length:186 start_codon:yes stop_codon:yes gene_type:complete
MMQQEPVQNPIRSEAPLNPLGSLDVAFRRVQVTVSENLGETDKITKIDFKVLVSHRVSQQM